MQKIIAVLLLLQSSAAYAVFGPLSFIPSQPSSSDQVSMRLTVGVCDTFLSVPSNFLNPEIAVIGSTIRVTKIGFSTNDFAACIFPPTTGEIPLQRFQAGSYRVELYLRDAFAQTQVRLVQTGALTVTQGAFVVEQVPSLSLFAVFSMLLLMLLSARLILNPNRG